MTSPVQNLAFRPYDPMTQEEFGRWLETCPPGDLHHYELLDGFVDKTAKTITGFTDHFSTFGILNVGRFCPTSPPTATSFVTFSAALDAVIPGGTIEVCDGTQCTPCTIGPTGQCEPFCFNDRCGTDQTCCPNTEPECVGGIETIR